MKRRQLIGLFGAVLVLGCPGLPAAMAEGVAGVPHLAIVSANGTALGDIAEGGDPQWSLFLQKLRALGYGEGAGLHVDRYRADGLSPADLAALARTVVDTQPDVIVTQGARVATALQSASAIILIVAMAGFDGLIQSMAHPGGNLTGVMMGPTASTNKELQFLVEVAPNARHIGWLGPADGWQRPAGVTARASAGALGIELFPLLIEGRVDDASMIGALQPVTDGRIDAIWVSNAVEMAPLADTIARLVSAAHIPAVTFDRRFAKAGLLMSYGPNVVEATGHLADYVDRILRGTDPGDLPVELPPVFDLVINLKAMQLLGVTLPPNLTVLVTEYIE